MDPSLHIKLPLPPLPPTQALNTTTFTVPPLDGSLSLPGLCDWQYIHSPNHPVFVYPGNDDVLVTVTWKETVRAIHRFGRLVRSLSQQDMKMPTDRPVYAILAHVGTWPPIFHTSPLTPNVCFSCRYHILLHCSCRYFASWLRRFPYFTSQLSRCDRPFTLQDWYRESSR